MTELIDFLWIALRTVLLVELVVITVTFLIEWRMSRSVRAMQFMAKHRRMLPALRNAKTSLDWISATFLVALVISYGISWEWMPRVVLAFAVWVAFCIWRVRKFPRRDPGERYTWAEHITYLSIVLWFLFSSSAVMFIAFATS